MFIFIKMCPSGSFFCLFNQLFCVGVNTAAERLWSYPLWTVTSVLLTPSLCIPTLNVRMWRWHTHTLTHTFITTCRDHLNQTGGAAVFTSSSATTNLLGATTKTASSLVQHTSADQTGPSWSTGNLLQPFRKETRAVAANLNKLLPFEQIVRLEKRIHVNQKKCSIFQKRVYKSHFAKDIWHQRKTSTWVLGSWAQWLGSDGR